MHEHRLVGWWLAGALSLVSHYAQAQSTAAFPTDTPPPPPRPAPTVKSPPRAPPTARPQPASKPPIPAKAPASPKPRTSPSRPVATPPPVAPAPTPPAAPAHSVQTPRVTSEQSSTASSTDPRPPVLPYYDGMPVPPGYQVVNHPATGIITGGVIGLGVSYGAGIIVGATQGFKNATGWLGAPLVGPWIAIAERKYEQCKTSTVEQARACVQHAVGEVQFITFVAVDGVFQLATGFLTLAGLLSSRDELIREDLLPKVSVIPPGPGRREWALSVQGRF